MQDNPMNNDIYVCFLFRKDWKVLIIIWFLYREDHFLSYNWPEAFEFSAQAMLDWFMSTSLGIFNA